MSVRPIVLLGDPRLRLKGKPVDSFGKYLHELLNDLAHTMRDAPGVGLAAPQLGEAMQACVIEVDDQLYELVNPRIVRAVGDDREVRRRSILRTDLPTASLISRQLLHLTRGPESCRDLRHLGCRHGLVARHRPRRSAAPERRKPTGKAIDDRAWGDPHLRIDWQCCCDRRRCSARVTTDMDDRWRTRCRTRAC